MRHGCRRPDVLVVGGGVIGLATAALCTRAGGGSPGSCDAKPVANTTAPGWMWPCDVRTAVPRPPAVPQRWVKGHLLATVPAPFRLRTAVAALEGLGLQLADGEIVAGGTLDEGDHDPAVRDDLMAGIRKALALLLPRTADLEVGHAWCCFRPTAADGQPVIDRVPGTENAWITCGHFRTGILIAAATGDVACTVHRDRSPPEGVAPFGLERFGG